MAPQYMPAALPAFYGLQPQQAAAAAAAAMYSTYGAAAAGAPGTGAATGGLDDLALRSAAGLHTLVGAASGQQQHATAGKTSASVVRKKEKSKQN